MLVLFLSIIIFALCYFYHNLSKEYRELKHSSRNDFEDINNALKNYVKEMYNNFYDDEGNFKQNISSEDIKKDALDYFGIFRNLIRKTRVGYTVATKAYRTSDEV